MFSIYTSYICASGGEHLHVSTHADMNTCPQINLFCIYMFCIYASYIHVSGGDCLHIYTCIFSLYICPVYKHHI